MYLLRLTLPLLLGGSLWLISWHTLTWSAQAQGPLTCLPQPILSKNGDPAYLNDPYQPLVYTLTNQASCTDTFLIEASTLSHSLVIDYWNPITVEIGANQDSPIAIHLPLMADVGNITDTLLITASSQMTPSIKATLTNQVIMLGGVYPGLYPVYLPLVIKTP